MNNCQKTKNWIKSKPRIYLTYRSIYGRLILEFKLIQKQIWKIIDKKIDEKKLMINMGGGYFIRRHWGVMDHVSSHYPYPCRCVDYPHDLTSNTRFPFTDNSVSFFFSSHTIEHIPQQFCQHIFNEMYRCLKLGGVLRISTPDFDLAYEAYGDHSKTFPAVHYEEKTLEAKFLHYFAGVLRHKIEPEIVQQKYKTLSKEEFANYFTNQISLDYLKDYAGNHFNWWNYEKLSTMLKKAGFQTVYRSHTHGSNFKELHGEGRNSGFDSTHPNLSLYVECVKNRNNDFT